MPVDTTIILYSENTKNYPIEVFPKQNVWAADNINHIVVIFSENNNLSKKS